MPRVLLVDDDLNLLQAISYILSREGFSVIPAQSGEEALRIAANEPPDAAVLDVNLPGIDGYEVCQRLKKSPETSRVRVLMLTERSAVDDVVYGLECLADDYVAKPCEPKILIARLQALLRRVEDLPHGKGPLQRGTLVIDGDAREVRVGDQKLELTRTEFDLLNLLASHANRVLSRDQILDHIRSENFATGERAVDVLVVGLRRKLGPRADYIRTVRGVGYKFES